MMANTQYFPSYKVTLEIMRRKYVVAGKAMQLASEDLRCRQTIPPSRSSIIPTAGPTACRSCRRRAEAVQACLDWVMMPPDQLIGIEPVRGLAITAEKLAVNAVMAGCLPMHFPVVITAWTAMMQEPFLIHGATASTGGCAILVVLNGPIRQEIGASGTFNALGNSDRATSVIGRAIRLCLINLLDARPGEIDRSTLGHPGKFSYCIAEDEEDTTWKSLSEQRGIERAASAVTVMAAGAPRQIMNEWTTKPEEILETFAADMRANLRHYSIHPGNYAIDHPQAAARAPAGGQVEQERHRQFHP